MKLLFTSFALLAIVQVLLAAPTKKKTSGGFSRLLKCCIGNTEDEDSNETCYYYTTSRENELSNGMNEICVPLLLSTSEAPSMTDDSNEFSYPGSEISLDMSEYLNEAFDKYLEDFYYSSDAFSEAQNSSGIEELEPADSTSGQQDEAKYHSSQSSSENDKPTVFQTEAVIEHVDPDSPLQTDRSSGQSSRSWGDSDKLTVIGNEDTDSTDNIPVSHEDGVYYAEVVYL